MNKLLVRLFITSFITFVACDEIKIDLSQFHPQHHAYSVFKNYYNLIDKITKINITDIGDNVGFFVIQVHTYVENITLSENIRYIHGSFVVGTNIGLVWDSDDSSALFYVMRNIQVDPSVQILLVINLYDQNDPVPGGCNLSFDNKVAPYQLTEYTDDVIIVKSQPPSVLGAFCDDKKVQVDMYHLYLYEYDNTVKTYFTYIEKMLTVKDILRYGRKVSDVEIRQKYKRMYSSYRGTGEVFAVVSKYRNRTSAYIPAVSYGCDLLKWEETCLAPVEIHWKFFCACVLIFGTFICFFGHRFFKLTLYIVSFSFGLLITYLAISMEEHFSFTERTITAFTVGFIYGIIWLLVWRKFGIPVLTVHLSFIMSGFLAASLLFNTVLADVYIFANSINFWLTFISVILLCIIISLPNMLYGHISSISFLGAYGCVAALSFYVGGNIPYIIINTYRRVAVKDFNTAVIDLPIQMIDIVQALLWALLLLFGIFIQLRHQRGKPPFPPNRNISMEGPVSERTPLIYRDIFAPPPPYSTIHHPPSAPPVILSWN